MVTWLNPWQTSTVGYLTKTESYSGSSSNSQQQHFCFSLLLHDYVHLV